jgi:hypothetical protein
VWAEAVIADHPPQLMSTKPVRSVDRAIDIVLNFIDQPVMGIGELQQRLGGRGRRFIECSAP